MCTLRDINGTGDVNVQGVIGTATPENDWVDIHLEVDLTNSTLVGKWQNIDDGTGTATSDWTTFWNSSLPFNTFDYFEIGGMFGDSDAQFDNLRITDSSQSFATWRFDRSGGWNVASN